MAEKLGTRRTDQLIREERVPEGYSATREEHAWHTSPGIGPSSVTGDNAGEVLEMADIMLSQAPPRNDTEYRVVLATTEITRWAL